MIDLLFAGNAGVFDGILTCMLSIFARSRIDEDLRVHVLTMDVSHLRADYVPISDGQIAFLQDVLRTHWSRTDVLKTDVTDLYRKELAGCPNESAYCSPYTLIRLFADVLPELPDKVLYLDVDLLFNRDIHELYDLDVSDVEYAAARDHYGKYLITPGYINAGVLLFNLKKMRETGILTRARGWLCRKKLVFADQSALIRSTTSRRLLPQKFNDQKFLHPKSTVVRHFSKRLFWLPYPHTDNVKPWQVSRVHKVFGYYEFDDVLFEYLYWKQEYERRHASENASPSMTATAHERRAE